MTDVGRNMDVKIIGKNHLKCVTDNIWDCWTKECYSNVTFTCKSGSNDTRSLSANKAVLAAGSRKLYLMLSETGDDEVNILIPERDFHTIKLLLQYIYTGEVFAVSPVKNELEALIDEWEIGCLQITPSALEPVLENPPVSVRECTASPINDNVPLMDESLTEDVVPLNNPHRTSPKKKRSTPGKAPLLVEPEEGSALNATKTTKDTEEDKADLLLSEAFLKEEKNRNQDLISSTKEMMETVKRHQLYVKHFIGPQYLVKSNIKEIDLKADTDPKIPCAICHKDIRKSYMKDHIVTSHSTDRPVLCEQCGASFAQIDGLKRHMYSTHPNESQIKTYPCKVCGKIFKSNMKLRDHMNGHTGEKPFQCPFCDKTFRLQCTLYRHKRIHTGEKPYSCTFCDKRFSTRTNYLSHLKTHDENRPLRSKNPFKCGTCGITFLRKDAFIIHEASHTNEPAKVPCSRCPETFPTLTLLKEHVKNQHADLIFKCDQCTKFFSTKIDLKNHLLTHQNPGASFPCEECGKSFDNKYSLVLHLRRTHTKERPFKCRFCDKDFKLKKMLCDHERLHTGEKPYKCPHCPKTFRINNQRRIHLRTHTGEKPYKCDFCDKAFAARENYRAHVKIHTGEKIQCDKCGEVFRTQIKLKLHKCNDGGAFEDVEEDGEIPNDYQDDED